LRIEIPRRDLDPGLAVVWIDWRRIAETLGCSHAKMGQDTRRRQVLTDGGETM
jgi:hypothetical protein